MAYDLALAERTRRALANRGTIVEMRMFGGLCFMLDGHMCCGVTGDDLMLRVGPDQHTDLLKKPHARPMDFTGRPLAGFLFVSPAGVASLRDLKRWLSYAIANVKALPTRARRSASKRN